MDRYLSIYIIYIKYYRTTNIIYDFCKGVCMRAIPIFGPEITGKIQISSGYWEWIVPNNS